MVRSLKDYRLRRLGLFLLIIRLGAPKNGLADSSNDWPTSRLGESYHSIKFAVVSASLPERNVTEVFMSPQPHPLLEGFKLNTVPLGELVDDAEPLAARSIRHQHDHDASQAFLTRPRLMSTDTLNPEEHLMLYVRV